MPPPPPHDAFAAAVARHRAGDLDGAEAAYGAILDAQPDHPGALHLLGVLDHQRGSHEEAVARIARAIELAPGKAAPLNNLGAALKALGRLAEALEAFGEAVRLDPAYADAHANLAAALQALGRTDEALPRFEAALRLRPDHLDALYNLGCLLLGRDDGRALATLRRAGELAPHRGDVLNNLGNALLARGRAEDAADALRRATAADPGRVEAWANLGGALDQLGDAEGAAAALNEAARLAHGVGAWPLRVAALCPAVFPDAEAIDRYRAGLGSALDAVRGAALPWDAGDLGVAGSAPPFNLAHHGRCNRRLKAGFAAAFAPARPRPPAGPADGPPRVGFVVTGRHEGIFLRCAGGVVAHLDPDRFRPVVLGPAGSLAVLRAAIGRPDAEYLPLPPGLAGAAAALAAARCDLLYFWEVGTDPLNYFLPFARAAPAQCTSWGTPETSGVPAVDCYLSGALIEPPGAQDHYTEELVLLSTLPTYQHPVARPGPPATRAEFGLPEGRTLYACPQRPQKFHPDFDATLAAILRRDPQGLVVGLEDRGGHAAARLRARFATAIPDVADRIVLLPRRSHDGYLRLLSLADVALDTPHYGAGSTAFDILGLGVPLVTLPGALAAGRFALGCYRRMGLFEAVAAAPEHFADLAVRLGADRGYRDDLSARILASSPALFGDLEAVREHERAFERTLVGRRD